MIFKHARTYGKSNTFDANKMNNQKPAIMFMNMHVSNKTDTPQNIVTPVKDTTPKVKTMLWGEPTWFFLHCLAERVHESSFDKIRGSMINLIVQLCNNLPCPECSKHASEYLKKINFQTITTKTQLKRMLWEFHNNVNERKGYAFFPLSGLSQYEKADFPKIVTDFFYHYKKRHYSMRLISDNMHRKDIAKNIENWLRQNKDHILIVHN